MKSFEAQKDRKLIFPLPSKSVRSVSNYGFYYIYSIPQPSSASTVRDFFVRHRVLGHREL